MSRVMTFSRVFPKYHPKAGQPTYFVEKLWVSIKVPIPCSQDQDKLTQEMNNILFGDFAPKHHTIRAGHRWKVGDKFSPRVWSGKPYNSKQIVIADDIEVVETWDFEVIVEDDWKGIYIDKFIFYEENNSMVTQRKALETLALNDGLTVEDFKAWFKWGQPFDGQIICWSPNIEY